MFDRHSHVPSKPLTQHQAEIERNKTFWERKPLIQEIYRGFYQQILARIDTSIPGHVIELGSGIGNLKKHFPRAICTDLFPNPWLDLVCDGYHLPFREGTASHLILFDVFHHLERPFAFLAEATRVLASGGRVILFEPFVSITSYPVYGLLHHEPVAFGKAIDRSLEPPPANRYYAAQGNASRLFFGPTPQLPDSLKLLEATSFAAFAYLLSGGLSKPAIYPPAFLPLLRRFDSALSHLPRIFGGRCLVMLEKVPKAA